MKPDSTEETKLKVDIYCKYLEGVEQARNERFRNIQVFATLSLQTTVAAFLVAKIEDARPYLWVALVVGLIISIAWLMLGRAARGNLRLKFDTARSLEKSLPLQPINEESKLLKALDHSAVNFQPNDKLDNELEQKNASKTQSIKQEHKTKKSKLIKARNHRYQLVEDAIPILVATAYGIIFVFEIKNIFGF